MKVKENVTLYICDYCEKVLRMKPAMVRHETHCTKNPKNVSACAGCVFMQEGTTEIEYQNPMYEYNRTCATFHCKKLNKNLYPYKVVRKGLLEKYPETFDGMEQMPNKCEHWNYTES